jgi:DNA-binding HxlR family transcriptional regulator
MALPREYTGQACSIAKALEVVGERWTLLIIRDAVFGVRRFSDFAAHLEIPKAVLSERLTFLVDQGILTREAAGGRDEYVLSAKGLELWPVLRALARWGDEHYAPNGRRRVLCHAGCGGEVLIDGRCTRCGEVPSTGDLESVPGPGLEPPGEHPDRVTEALQTPHRLLSPLRSGE